MNFEPMVRFFEAHQIAYALIGGQAVVVRGYLRATLDYDFLAADNRLLNEAIWQDLRAAETVEVRKGDFEDPLAGVVRITFSDGVADVVIAKRRWQQAILERAEVLAIDSVDLLVARTSDLILLKLDAGGFLDLQDVAVLLSTSNRDELINEVQARVEDLDRRAQQEWRRVLAST